MEIRAGYLMSATIPFPQVAIVTVAVDYEVTLRLADAERALAGEFDASALAQQGTPVGAKVTKLARIVENDP